MVLAGAVVVGRKMQEGNKMTETAAIVRCPACECNALRVVTPGAAETEYGCMDCGEYFWTANRGAFERKVFEDAAGADRVAVDWQLRPGRSGAACPNCGAFPMPVRSSPKASGGVKVRNHRCGACGWTGSSVEKVGGDL